MIDKAAQVMATLRNSHQIWRMDTYFLLWIPILLGFHDAIGDAVTLSITPKHLQGLGLIQKSVDDTAHDINFLFGMAMDKVRNCWDETNGKYQAGDYKLNIKENI